VDTFLVPIDSEISVSQRPEDYESFINDQFPLHNLHANALASTNDVFRILSWEEVIHLPLARVDVLVRLQYMHVMLIPRA